MYLRLFVIDVRCCCCCSLLFLIFLIDLSLLVNSNSFTLRLSNCVRTHTHLTPTPPISNGKVVKYSINNSIEKKTLIKDIKISNICY